MTSLEDQVRTLGTPIYASTKAEVIAVYQAEYKGRGQAGWKQHLVHDLAEQTGMKTKSLEKRFEKRIINPEKRNAAQYETLGKTLPPIDYEVPEDGAIAKGTLWIRVSKTCEPRYDKEVFLSADDLKAMRKSDNMAQYVVDRYMEESGTAAESCAEPKLTVTAA
jgi:hypothetical protein